MPAAKVSKLNTAMHTAGIYSDMTVDGPEIGTLVVIVDRAKNLPNRRTMGKQDPYCACRLGKDAKKTTTDKRGGQVPRWDQELRFTVHDSPDYYQIKVSVFNDDKKTELIGENWVSLDEVIVPGGGQSDVWHNLNCKGKYAGEVRLELTYYDTRPKPEKPVEESLRTSSRIAGAIEGEDGEGPAGLNGPRSTPVKRRPLPGNPASAGGSPADVGRVPLPASGPRGYGTPPRQSLPQTRSGAGTPGSGRRSVYNNGQPQPSERRRPLPTEHVYPETRDDPFIQDVAGSRNGSRGSGWQPEHDLPQLQEDRYQQCSHYDTSEAGRSHSSFSQQPQSFGGEPIGLPELPPLSSSRRPQSSRPSYSSSTQNEQDVYRPHQPELHHSHSAPIVPAQQYCEEPQEHRQQLHHTQSDILVHQPQPLRLSRSGTMEPIYDNHQQEQQQEYHQPAHHTSGDYSLSLAQSNPPYHGYDTVGPRDEYSPHQHWDMQPTVEDEPPPPPPPAHRDSAPNSAQRQIQSLPRDYQADYAPAPLKIGAARDMHSRPVPYEEPEEYQHQHQQLQYVEPDYGNGHSRRYTDPVGTSPIAQPHEQQAVYRPRAHSGDALRKSPTRDDELFLPEVNNSGYGTNASSPTQSYHQNQNSIPAYGSAYTSPISLHTKHRNSLPQHDHSPAAPSPLALGSPHSLREASSQIQPPTPSLIVRYNQKQIAPTKRATPQRPFHHHTASEPYGTASPAAYSSPTRQSPHPLSQEVPTREPPQQQYGVGAPQLPHNNSTPDFRTARETHRSSTSSATKRKSVSPRPPSSHAQTGTSVPFGPDSFDQFNPIAGRSTSSLLNHPATSGPGTPVGDASNPGSRGGSRGGSPYATINGFNNASEASKIVDFHGNEIDPSDRLPETSWAPEPEPKGKDKFKDKPSRERERLTGARGPGGSISAASTRGSPGRMSFYGSASASPLNTTAATSPLESPGVGGVVARNRLQKRNTPGRPQSMVSLPSSQGQPFRDVPNPPMDNVNDGYGNRSPGGGHGLGGGSPGGYDSRGGSYTGVNAPLIPAKVPFGDGFANEDLQALSEEINSIDLGPPSGGTRGRVGKVRMLGYR